MRAHRRATRPAATLSPSGGEGVNSIFFFPLATIWGRGTPTSAATESTFVTAGSSLLLLILLILATINPVTYVLEGLRSLVLAGWEWDRIGYALLSIAGLGAFTLSMTLGALRSRTA